MPANIKAIVFKTKRLQATRLFFETTFDLLIKESSARHFVIYSKGIRVVFVEALNDFEVEIYLQENPSQCSTSGEADLSIDDHKKFKDPNGIHIVITR